MRHRTINKKGQHVKNDVLVVGVDISKTFHVAVAREPDGGFSGAYRFTSDADGFSNFNSWLDERKQGGSFVQVLVGVESTSHYWITLVAWLQRRGIEVVQVNPLHTRRAKDLYDNTPSKTDKKDARIIADLVSQGKFLRCVVPRGRYADLRYLVLVRQRLIKERTGVLNTVHRVLDVLFPEFTRVFNNLQTKTSMYLLRYCYTPALLLSHSRSQLCVRIYQISRGTMRAAKIEELYHLAQTSIGVTDGIEGLRIMLFKALRRYGQLVREIAVLEERLAALVCGLSETQYLRSMPGIGLLTVATLLGESGGLRHYQSAEEVIKLAGLNLYELSSGKHRGKRRITRRGRSLLRAGLYRAAVCVVRRCGVLRAFYERLRARGKYGAVALVAVACKLMRILFSLVRDNRMFRNNAVVVM